jgi:hypothetical protein
MKSPPNANWINYMYITHMGKRRRAMEEEKRAELSCYT